MGYRNLLIFFFVSMIFAKGALAQTPTCGIASKYYSKDSINITTFGASTVEGVGGFSFQGYLQQDFMTCFPGKVISITNNGIYGQTTTQGLARFPAAIAGRTGFVCILMGVNDALNLVINTPVKYTAKQITEAIAVTDSNMSKMIQLSLASNLIPIIGTIQFVNPAVNKQYATVNALIKRINADYEALVNKYPGKVYLADINGYLGQHYKEYYQADGLHPNDAGYKVIALVWFDAINDAIKQNFTLITLDQNYPNPAKTYTNISFNVSQAADLNIQLYNMLGTQVKTITSGFFNEGQHIITNVSLAGLKPGVYIYVMSVAGRQLSKKMIIVGY